MLSEQRQVIDIVVRERRARLGGRNILLRGSRLRNIAGGVVDGSIAVDCTNHERRVPRMAAFCCPYGFMSGELSVARFGALHAS